MYAALIAGQFFFHGFTAIFRWKLVYSHRHFYVFKSFTVVPFEKDIYRYSFRSFLSEFCHARVKQNYLLKLSNRINQKASQISYLINNMKNGKK